MSELVRRVLVAVAAAPLALGAIWLGDAALATLLSAMAAVGAWEYFRLAREGGVKPLVVAGVVLSAMIPMAAHAAHLEVVRLSLVSIPVVGVALLALAIWARGVDGKPLTAVATTVFGALYTGGTLSVAYILRYHGYAIGDAAGSLMVIVPVLLTWASDTGAYFSGRLIGGRKLMPSVSPGKTIAGAVGAVIATVAACWALVRWLLIPQAQLGFSPWGLVAFGVTVSVVAQLGDLAESLLKREAGVKDSGTLFPGHGGVLDRLDSLFFVLPVAWFLYDLLLIPVPGGR